MAPFRPDEFVVATTHEGLVLDALAELAIPVLDREVAPELGLTRIGLHAAAAVERLGAPHLGAAGAPAPPAERALLPLEVMLHHLRTLFAERYAGWWPTMGKNRVMATVAGTPTTVSAKHQTIPGGGDRPSAARGALAPRTATDGAGVRIGLVDTRLFAHPWLTGGYLAAPRNLFDPAAATAAASAGNWTIGHATFIAGLILRQAPGAIVELHPGLGDDGTADSWSVGRVLASLAGSGLDVLNLSLGCYTEDGQPPLVLATALSRIGSGTVVVAAAGNDGAAGAAGSSPPLWPAAFDAVVAVGAVGPDDKRPAWSPNAPWVTVCARGVDVLSTYPVAPDGHVSGAPFARWSGTSFAAATVSGAIAQAARPDPGPDAGARLAAGTARQALEDLLAKAPRDDNDRPIVGVAP